MVRDSTAVRVHASELVEPLTRLAEALHAEQGDRHHVLSPLGAWIVLALAAHDGASDAVAAALGVEPARAASLAGDLLRFTHPAISAAAAVWATPGIGGEAWARFLQGLPLAVTRGPIPSQREADAWTKRHTRGQLHSFPGRTEPDELGVLIANALATRVTWGVPYDLAPVERLGDRCAWRGHVRNVMRWRGNDGEQYIATTRRAGDVAVHTAAAREDLVLTSVIAAPEVAPADVLATAYEIATARASDRDIVRRSLDELPLGDGPAWHVTEREANGRGAGYDVLVPAWEARTHLDLSGSTAFREAAEGLAALARLPLERVSARQAAVARYHRMGFEAAAATMMRAVLGRAGMGRRERVAQLRFAHPFAVVAVPATAWNAGTRTLGRTAWDDLPAFSAWVAEAAEPDETTR